MAYTAGTDNKKISKKQEGEILTLLDNYFQTALDDPSWREHRDEAVKCFDYKENRQWTKEEVNNLSQRGQAPTINNQVKVTVDRIVGQFVQIKSRTAFKPRNQAPDTDVAQAMEDIYTFIRQNSGLSFEERDVMEDGATGGFGVFDVCIEDNANGIDQEVVPKAEDCFNVFPDPKSRSYDWNRDARFICRAKWVDVDYAKELYPAKAKDIGRLFSDSGNTELSLVDNLKGETYLDYKRNRLRMVEVQYKKFANVETYVFSDGKVMDGESVDDTLLGMAKQAGVSYTTRKDRKEQLCIGVFCSNVLFEHGVSKRKRFSLVPYFVNRKKNGAPYSPITTALPLQDAINKRESKALALLTLNQAKYERGAIQDKDELAIQMAKPDGQIVLEEGFYEKFEMDKNLELANTQFQMHNAAKDDFRSVTGINPDALGEKSEVRSGIGIQRKVAMTGLIVAPIYDNFRRTREALAKTIHDAVRIAYTEQKILNITDNPKAARVVALDKNMLNAVKQAEYDIIISEEEDYDTVHEQQMDILAKNLPAILQFGPAWGRVLFEMSTIRNKQELLTQVDQIMAQTKPNPEPNIAFSAQLDKLSVPEKIFLYQKMGAPPQLLQMIAQASPPPSQMLQAHAQVQQNAMEAQSEVAKTQQATQTEALKAQTEQQKAHTAQVKGQMDLAKAGMDMQAKQAETQHKVVQMQAQNQMAQQSHAMDMQAREHDMALKEKVAARSQSAQGSKR